MAVYGSLRTYYNGWLIIQREQLQFMMYQKIISEAFEKAFILENNISEFTATGIYAFDPNVFDKNDFVRCAVTDSTSF